MANQNRTYLTDRERMRLQNEQRIKDEQFLKDVKPFDQQKQYYEDQNRRKEKEQKEQLFKQQAEANRQALAEQARHAEEQRERDRIATEANIYKIEQAQEKQQQAERDHQEELHNEDVRHQQDMMYRQNAVSYKNFDNSSPNPYYLDDYGTIINKEKAYELWEIYACPNYKEFSDNAGWIHYRDDNNELISSDEARHLFYKFTTEDNKKIILENYFNKSKSESVKKMIINNSSAKEINESIISSIEKKETAKEKEYDEIDKRNNKKIDEYNNNIDVLNKQLIDINVYNCLLGLWFFGSWIIGAILCSKVTDMDNKIIAFLFNLITFPLILLGKMIKPISHSREERYAVLPNIWMYLLYSIIGIVLLTSILNAILKKINSDTKIKIDNITSKINTIKDNTEYSEFRSAMRLIMPNSYYNKKGNESIIEKINEFFYSNNSPAKGDESIIEKINEFFYSNNSPAEGDVRNCISDIRTFKINTVSLQNDRQTIQTILKYNLDFINGYRIEEPYDYFNREIKSNKFTYIYVSYDKYKDALIKDLDKIGAEYTILNRFES